MSDHRTDNRTGRRYSVGAMIFHWTIAVAVIANWRIAEAAEHAEGAARSAIFANHKALGIIILVLTLGRLAWRWTHPVPPLPSNLATWEKTLARTVHVVFYILLIGLPLGAWIANSLNGRSIDMFGLFTIPPLPVGENSALGGTIYSVHATGGSIFIYLIGLHILGALKHTFRSERRHLPHAPLREGLEPATKKPPPVHMARRGPGIRRTTLKAAGQASSDYQKKS